MKKVIVVVVCLIVVLVMLQPTYAKKAFGDVSGKTGGHFEAIHFLNELDVYDYKGSTFQLTQPVTRGEVAKILSNLLRDTLPQQRTYQGQFQDLEKSAFKSEIIWAYEVGIFDGNEGGLFNPQQPIKRSHLAKIFVHSFQLTGQAAKPFSDVASTSWYYQDVMILAGNGITTGNEKNQFLPNANVTSAQLATFLYRAMQLGATMQQEIVEVPQQAAQSVTVFNSEYDFKWHQLGKDKQLTLEGILDNKAVAGYLTKKGDSFSGAPSLQIGIQSAADVKADLGQPIEVIAKGNTNMIFNTSNERAMYLLDGYYVTYFFDVHKNNRIRSILYIDEKQEIKKVGFYGTKASFKQAQQSAEQLMVELMNQARVMEGLQPMRYAKEWTVIGRGHSLDMSNNHYFNHVNLSGEEPLDRMRRGGMDTSKFSTWGENISYGQYNFIYAHEAFMNSYGHRVNILHGDFEQAIVGIETNDKGVPYYTVKFYTERSR